MNRKVSLNQKGFSLVELMAVVAIIGVLAIIGIPQYQKFRVKAFQAEAKTQLAALHTAQRAFYLEYQGYHTSLKVIGYAPNGKARYNVGFGQAGITPAIAPSDNVNLSSKEMCTGTYGLGTDINCDMIIDTPELSPGLTTSPTTYRAGAYSFDDLLVAQNENQTGIEIASRLILGESAHASQFAEINGATVDGWFIDENNRLMNQKMQVDCVTNPSCLISLPPESQ